MYKLSDLLADLMASTDPTPNLVDPPGPQHPGIWSMPCRGIEWCDCGNHHPVSRIAIEEFTAGIARDPRWLTHAEISAVAMDFWRYTEVCRFFVLALERAATVVCGAPAERYRHEQGIEIIGYFSKTWQGCPEEDCSGGFKRYSPR